MFTTSLIVRVTIDAVPSWRKSKTDISSDAAIICSAVTVIAWNDIAAVPLSSSRAARVGTSKAPTTSAAISTWVSANSQPCGYMKRSMSLIIPQNR